jgi:hypothetical protein
MVESGFSFEKYFQYYYIKNIIAENRRACRVRYALAARCDFIWMRKSAHIHRAQ